MVIDSSAFVAILLGEPEAEELIEAISADATLLASAATVLETSVVMLSRKGEQGLVEFRTLTARASIQVVGFDPEHVDAALNAFRHFGKGRHAASLNLGDCFSYALAKVSGQPLLFKGEDFARTDAAVALPRR